MAAILAAVPDDIRRAFVNQVPDFLRPGDLFRDALRAGDANVEGVPVFTLTLQNLRDGAAGRDSRFAGYRVWSSRGDQVVIADVEVPEGRPRVVSVSRDERNKRAPHIAQRVLQSADYARNDDFDFAYLRIPGVLTDLFWLRSKSGGGDLAVPVLSAAESIEVGREYPLDHVLDVLRGLAAEFQEFDATELPPSSLGV